MPSEKGAEAALDKLKKIPANMACANCGVFAKQGHGAVVMAYATFVCHTCKSAHQSYSHLCKSVSMSFWSHKEVNKSWPVSSLLDARRGSDATRVEVVPSTRLFRLGSRPAATRAAARRGWPRCPRAPA